MQCEPLVPCKWTPRCGEHKRCSCYSWTLVTKTPHAFICLSMRNSSRWRFPAFHLGETFPLPDENWLLWPSVSEIHDRILYNWLCAPHVSQPERCTYTQVYVCVCVCVLISVAFCSCYFSIFLSLYNELSIHIPNPITGKSLWNNNFCPPPSP